MGKSLVLAVVACLITLPAVAAETKGSNAKLHLTAANAKKANAPKAAAKPSAKAEAPVNSYQLEQDGCCYGSSKGPWY